MIKPRILSVLAFAGTVLHAEAPPQQQKTDTNPGTTTMPTVTVVAKEQSLTVPSAQQAAERLRQIPGGAGIVTSESYKTGRADTLKDALDFATGVFTQTRFGADEARISVRGSGIQRTFHGRGLKLLQDGIPLNLADGGFDMQSFEPLAVDYIEVFRGANALQFGATTLGGAINFISPTGYTASPFQARFEYGSFDTIHGQLSAAGVSGPFDYYLTGTHFSTDGYRDHSVQNTQRYFGNFGYKLSDDMETRLYLTYVHTDSELPGNITKEQLALNPRVAARNPFFRVFDVVDSNWKRDFDFFRVANRTTWRLDADSTFTALGYYAHKELDHPILFVIDQESDDFGFDFTYRSDAELGGRQNHFLLGFSPTFGYVHDRRFANDLGSRGAMIADDQTFSANLDLYLQDVHYLTDRLAVVAGGSISYAVRNNQDNFGPSLADSSNNVDQNYWGFNPKLGLLYDLNARTQLFFNASRSFEPPTFGELSSAGGLANVDIARLDAQTATSLEFGTRGSTTNGRVKWDFAYYFAWVDEELMEYTIAPGLSKTINAGRTLHQGVELGLDLTLLDGIFSQPVAGRPGSEGGKSAKAVQPVAAIPGDRLVFHLNYLWNDFRYDDDSQFGDNQMPGIPEQYFRAELLYEHPCGFYAGPNLEWVPKGYPVDSANTLSTDSYALLGFKVGYKTKKGLSIFVEACNLTDERYAATTGVVDQFSSFNPALFSPGNGRSVFAGVEYKF